VVVGKTNLHEFAYGITSENEHFGDVGNPLAPDRFPGGSSGGSAAALAAGLCDAALGTDSAGSIRIPAACCGIVGFKPTHGVVPMDGCWPLAPSFDTAGPMARDVESCVAMMKALGPSVPSTPVALEDIRVAVAWVDDADPGVAARVRKASALFRRSEGVAFPLMPANIDPAFQREVADGQHVALGGPEAGEPPPTAAGRRLRFGRGRGLISRINGGRVIASPS